VLAAGGKRSRVEGDKGIEGAGVRSGSCRVGSFARDGFGVVGPKRAARPLPPMLLRLRQRLMRRARSVGCGRTRSLYNSHSPRRPVRSTGRAG
jgi:hypothetical protein